MGRFLTAARRVSICVTRIAAGLAPAVSRVSDAASLSRIQRIVVVMSRKDSAYGGDQFVKVHLVEHFQSIFNRCIAVFGLHQLCYEVSGVWVEPLRNSNPNLPPRRDGLQLLARLRNKDRPYGSIC